MADKLYVGRFANDMQKQILGVAKKWRIKGISDNITFGTNNDFNQIFEEKIKIKIYKYSENMFSKIYTSYLFQ